MTTVSTTTTTRPSQMVIAMVVLTVTAMVVLTVATAVVGMHTTHAVVAWAAVAA